MVPSFTVPARYFYALASSMPTTVTPDVRYRLATLADEKTLRDQLHKAIDDGVIVADPAVTPEMAARRLRALGNVQGVTPVCAPGLGLALVQGYANYHTAVPPEDPADDIAPFWNGVMANVAQARAHLELCLAAVTLEADSRPLINNAIAKGFQLDSVKNLDAKPWGGPPPPELDAAAWHHVFGDPPPAPLPAITAPGSLDERIGAFIRRLRKFFEVLSGNAAPGAGVPDAPPDFGIPAFDPIGDFFNAYRAEPGHAGFVWGEPFDAGAEQNAIDAVAMDDRGRLWLRQAVEALNELYRLTDLGPGVPPPLRFSLTEALYARGFTSAAGVVALSLQDFTAALFGTPAYGAAANIYANAGGAGGPFGPPAGPFAPINDGTLANCIPACDVSPLGKTAYLHDLLNVGPETTCDEVEDDDRNDRGDRQDDTVAKAIKERRGDLGALHVTCANAETPLPVIDLVNECLESMVANDSTSGVVYDTAVDAYAGHQLRGLDEPDDPDADPYRHDPATLFAALPEHSAPATPVAEPQAFTKLAQDFSSPLLPYDEALDVNRSYLGAMGATRFGVMRCFRQDITEFVLDPAPADEPAGFPRHQWRYPVRIDIAREYLGISPQEYDQLFTVTPAGDFLAQLYGFLPGTPAWMTDVRLLSEFLRRTGLSYCEFIELWRSEFVKFHALSFGDQREKQDFPGCEPCYLDKIAIVFDDPADPATALARLAVFIRLWRKLQTVRNAKYTFRQLRDICLVLGLLDGGGNVNPDFIRQLAAFQILRDELRLPLEDPEDAPPAAAVGADRTHILALWVDAAAKRGWAIEQLIASVEHYARSKHHRHAREPEFLKLLTVNLDPLSRLGGFDPAVPARSWHSVPTHTLRFAEVLSKIYTSRFGIGEILYLYGVDPHLGGDDPFPLDDAGEALENPLELPDDNEEFSLWSLRRKLFDVDVSAEELERWTWPRIGAALREKFGFPPPGVADPLYQLASHFFPGVLEADDIVVEPKDQRYAVSLVGSSAAMWNTPESPFSYYDSGADSELRAHLPLRDEAVFTKLSRIRPLNALESQAVRDLYYMPRYQLAKFGYLFPTLGEADLHLIQEPSEERRWSYFRHAFAMFFARCEVIARHLAEHVQSATEHEDDDTVALSWKLLSGLLADENFADPPPWENDNGHRPNVTWNPPPLGSAFAALVGLVGTGLLAEYRVDDGAKLLWRDLRGPTNAFGDVRNDWNLPVPVIVPELSFDFSDQQKRWAQIRNAVAMAGATAKRLGGAQPYSVRWQGVLLVEESGTYRFFAGGPAAEGEEPALEHLHNRSWRITLQRGEKEWLLLTHHWHDDERSENSAALHLKRGAYNLTIDFQHCGPSNDDLEDAHAQHTGFELKYRGPDTGDRIAAIPRRRLYLGLKSHRLSHGIDESVEGTPRTFLHDRYTSTLRDVRRTYQRAFKALLFAHRFDLSAQPFEEWGQSEIGFILDHADQFAGLAFFNDGAWKPHRADFDFNLLPLLDNYFPQDHALDDRTGPTLQRQQALFDIWERIFDYTELRRRARRAPERPVWLLFDEAAENQPDNPAHLLRHLDVDLAHSDLVLHFFDGLVVGAAELVDERWSTRVFMADRCVKRFVSRFAFEDVRDAHPDRWAAGDPGAPGSGNEDLTLIVRRGLIENGAPRRYQDLERINDGIRSRTRDGLVAYLCGMDRVALPWPGAGFARNAKDLTELLLIDVSAGLCEKASRVEEAITAVQTLVQRARLGLEPPAVLPPGFIEAWDGRFATFRTWQACVRRTLYRENWIELDELDRARRTEAFRFLEDQLRRSTLTIPVPGGATYWNAGELPPSPGLALLQRREPSAIRFLEGPREGLNLLGTTERSGQRSWLAPVQIDDRQQPPPPPPNRNNREEVVVVVAADRQNVPPQTRTFPLWIEAAIRLGARFLRVAAAGVPPASARFEPRPPAHRDPCCKVCGCMHDPVIDEYYFWLVDTRWFDAIEQAPDWPGWHDPEQLPKLLEWPSKPMVHLMWSHVHDGEIMQPRRSVEGVRLPDPTAPGTTELTLVGRTADSLLFAVANGVVPPGHSAPPPDPGFRYDIAADDAAVVPAVIATPPPPPNPNGLTAYPFFVYFTPGAPLFPLTPFSEATSVAAALRAHCRFEAAVKWYDLAYDPLRSDNRWCPRPAFRTEGPNEIVVPAGDFAPGETPAADFRPVESFNRPPERERLCCRFGDISDDVARNRAVTLDVLETLLDWGDCLMQRNAPEAFQQARLIYDTGCRILGPAPLTVQVDEAPQPPPTVADFVPAGAALNPRLMALYERFGDRLSLIHACLTARRLRNGKPRVDMPYFGDDPARDGWWTAEKSCACEEECCCPGSPYRFIYLVQKANELAGEVRALGSALLAAFEKGDAEYLAFVRSGHDEQIAALTLAVRKHQWRDADWQVQALQKTKEIAQTNRRYYATLLANGLNAGELDYQALVGSAIASIDAATVSESIGTILGVIPDIFVGTVDFVQLAIGTKLASVFQGIARISMDVSQILNTTAGLRLTQAGWERREQEWRHQVEIFDLEIEQIERQILGAERRRDAALRELEIQQRQIENSREVLNILRDKFTNQQLYLWLQRETAALYYQLYELALCLARQAQRAFNYERGYTRQQFIPPVLWDDLRQGLLAGERLQLAVRTMEKAYLDQNVREYELTRHVSLRLCFAEAFLALKLTGACVVEIPEWFFDLDYPGHYMRRLKNVMLTIPAVVGPYTGVHCRLTLLSSSTRIDPRLHDPVGECCHEAPPRPLPPRCGCWPAPRPHVARKMVDASTSGYVPLRDDSRIVRHYAATEAIATSSAQNDSGLFELNFRDERYFPFEFAGAVSRWRIELPAENNYFDLDTLSDVILHLNYTAREGGDVLRSAASEAARAHIPDDGRRVFDLRREMPDEWARFQAHHGRQRFHLRLSRDMFPFLPGDREVGVQRLELWIAAKGASPSTHREVEFTSAHERGCACSEEDEREFQCVGGEAWPGFYHGAVDVNVATLRGSELRHLGTFEFEERVEDVTRAFLVVHYEVR